MGKKPTYEELEQRVKELGKEATERKRAEEALKESEQRFRELADLLPQPVFELDLDGNFTYSNRCGFETFGYSHKDLANGVNALELFIPEERQRVWQNIKKRLAGKEFEDHEYTGLGKDGSTFPILVYSDAIVANNKVVGVRGIVLDITERKRTEEALQKARDELERRVEERTTELLKANEQLEIEIEEHERTEEKYKTLVESSLTGIFIHQDGKYVFMNDRFADIHGYQPDELLGRDPLTLIHPDEREAVRQLLSKRLKGEDAPSRYEARRLKKDAETIWCEMMATRIEYAGRPAIMGNVINITERKQAEEALMESTRRLQLSYEQAIAYAKELNKEIDVRKRAEEALYERKEKLKAQAHELEEMNTALKVLLKQRGEDRTELEEKVLSNVEELVLPYVQMLKKSRLGAEQMSYVSIIESNLTDIVSPFLRKLSSKYLSLTPKEIQIADLIKLGNTTKEIADLLNVSIGAIEFHRENIRAKLGLKNQPINLRTHLLSFE